MVRQDEQARRCWPLERLPCAMFKPVFVRPAPKLTTPAACRPGKHPPLPAALHPHARPVPACGL